MIRYYAYAADTNHRFFEERLITMEPGKFSQRTEVKTGVIYRTSQEADRAMREKNATR